MKTVIPGIPSQDDLDDEFFDWDGYALDVEENPYRIDPKDLPSDDELLVHEHLARSCAHGRGFTLVTRSPRTAKDRAELSARAYDFVVCNGCGYDVLYRLHGDQRQMSPPEHVLKAEVPRYSQQFLAYNQLAGQLRGFGWGVMLHRINNGYRCSARRGSTSVTVEETLPTDGEAICRLVADMARNRIPLYLY
jgi:hypothetical protein